MGRHSPDNFVPPRILVLLCLVLVTVVIVEVGRPLSESLEAVAAPPDGLLATPREAGNAMETSFAMSPLGRYAEVLARPPFAKTRRPPPAASGSSPAAPIAAALVGVILGSASHCALIEHGEPAQVTRVAEGQEIDGWTITSILRDRVLLSRAEASGELRIKDRPSRRQPAQNLRANHDAAPLPAHADPPSSRVRRLTAAEIPPFISGPPQPPIQNGARTSRAANGGASAVPNQRERKPYGPGDTGG